MAGVQSGDALVTDRKPAQDSFDMGDHLRTYRGFLSLAKWFVIHLSVIVLALYCFIIAHQVGLGFFLLFISVCLLVYGVTRRPSVRHDMATVAEEVRDLY